MPKQVCFGLKPNVKLWESIRFLAVCINFKHLKIYQDFIVMCDQMTSLQWRRVKVKKVTRTLFFCLFICWFRLQNFGRIQCKLTLWLEILSFFKWILWFWWPGDSQSFKFTQPVYTYTCTMWTIDSICGISSLFMIYWCEWIFTAKIDMWGLCRQIAIQIVSPKSGNSDNSLIYKSLMWFCLFSSAVHSLWMTLSYTNTCRIFLYIITTIKSGFKHLGSWAH